MKQTSFPSIRHGIILEKSTLPFEDQAVLNPGVIEVDGITHMFYRAVHDGNYSSIGYAQFRNGTLIYRADKPVLMPERAYERHGIEDPRIVFCEGVYYLFYTVFDGLDAQVVYATASKLPHFTRRGIISPHLSYRELHKVCSINPAANQAFAYFCQTYQPLDPSAGEVLLWEKDTFIFPKKFRGKFALLHRIKPEIQLLFFEDFKQLTDAYWLKYLQHLETGTLLRRKYWFESGYIGGGVPPIETEAGWLLIYHAVEATTTGSVYRGAVALLDLHDPSRVIGRLDYPLLSPETDWERQGDVNNVVFPTGALVKGNELLCYYGAADKRIALATFNLSDLLTELLNHPV